ncbi:MAG: hypothetical protein NZ898_06460 [Myxococcota bacterium]|nr:hypothetical protein [Myxococcota bacterium]MDW8362665.1 glycine cleavage T C-terminal barrel domain-containing protein [Myxococcales bacterium]
MNGYAWWLRQARTVVTSVGVRQLDDRVVDVRGPDARSWLNGQLTADVRAITPGEVRYALVLHVKGRILSDAWVLDRGESFSLLLPAAAHDAVIERFEQHIIMEDVELSTAPDRRVLTAQGPAAPSLDLAGAERWPTRRLGSRGVDFIVPADHVAEAWTRLCERAGALGGEPLSDPAWELARLRAAVPRFGIDFGPRCYPQEAGLHRGAVSFTKGCYVGQEVVVMLEHRGHASRRLVALSIEGLEPLREDAAITTVDGEPAGEITSSAADPEAGTVRALGYVRRKLLERGEPLRVDGRSAIVVGDAVDPGLAASAIR